MVGWLGFTGFDTSDFGAPFCPAIDIGWTLARDVWGHGYATEGASPRWTSPLTSSNSTRSCPTAQLNARSQAVMQRLGMTHDLGDDFGAPWYEIGHPRRRFVLYRMKASDWPYGAIRSER